MYQDVLFSLYIPRVGERLLCFSHTTGKRTKTDFVLSCQMTPRFPGSECYLIQTLNGLRYAVLVPTTPKEAAMSPSNAKAVVAATAFVMPSNGQISVCVHRTTNPSLMQEKTRPFPGFSQKTSTCGRVSLSINLKAVARRLASALEKILNTIRGDHASYPYPSQPEPYSSR